MRPALDEAWFDRYRAIKVAAGDAYEKLEPLPQTLVQKKHEFEASNYTKNISLLSDRVDVQDCELHLSELHRLKTDIESSETNDVVREAYLDAIADLSATIKLMIAGATGDKQQYESANLVVYDRPDEHIFRALCHWIRHDATQAKMNNDPHLTELANTVIGLIPNLHDNHQILIPTEYVFHKVRQTHRVKGGYYDFLFGDEGMPENAYITQEEGDAICQKILENIGSTWTVKASENNLWAVMRSRKELVSPPGYRLDRDEFIGIVSHEIGSHVLEEVNGEQQPLRLLGTGLAAFENGNEGRAFLREQIVYQNEETFLEQFAWEYIALLHLSVSLASGLHEKQYDFIELYHTLYPLYAFWREKRMPHATNNEQFAREEAWFLCVRIMKGTDGTGGCYMKDSVYLEGNIRCWQLAELDPSIILFGDQGMFDVTNERHREIVRSINP